MPTKKEMIHDLQQAGQPIPEDWTKFNQHATATIDYGYIVSGQITLVTGDGTQQDLKPGDFVAQIGAEHTWINDHDEPCIILCFMLGIENRIAQQVTF
jgi:quercetin dioxygenase-like cupin family protein